MNNTKEIGELLKKVRTARNIDISKISEDLRIRKKYLEAIEMGLEGDMPGPAYIQGYTKMYATYLGVGDEVLRADSEKTPRVAKKYPNVKKHIDDNWVLSSIFAILIFVLFVLIWIRSDASLNSSGSIMDQLLEDEKYDFLD
ncbi:MAG: helix-turn-helix domain-containing protein [Rickettsiaceae bacterium]|nr:helix-turn-helix domain-containing protein [Rickettsiaceae bacterium]